RATDIKTSAQVAIKILIGSMFGDRNALRRFEREARTSASLHHPNIVSVYDFGELEGQGAYLVMEYVDGRTMRSIFEEQPITPRHTIANWFQQILDGMKLAHDSNVIHRDLKPENILVKNQVEVPSIKILDFGLAKIKRPEGVSSTNITGAGSVLGTIAYMSPEQITGGDVDARSDIFSLGVVLAEAITGQTPFQGETSSDIALAVLQKSYHLIDDPLLDEVLQKTIAKKPSARYASIAEFRKALIPLLLSTPV
ncbi:MAG TPA: serine/threonine-protein kinase, partial [Acidobacteriota bacterium]|nr:serine/threonine-protein kinase [Acidobacteriota bacterium]